MSAPHDYFGIMELNEKRREYRAKLDFSEAKNVSVTIHWEGISPAEALQQAQEICEKIRPRESEYRSKASHELLSLYNDDWRGDGPILDVEGFMCKISLADVSIGWAERGSKGSATLYYADGDLFASHYIEVYLDDDFNYVDAAIGG